MTSNKLYPTVNTDIALGVAALPKSGGDMTGALGIGASPNALAVLDLTSTTKGFLPPRMTDTQRTAISSPPDGLIVFDTSEDEGNGALYVSTGEGWKMISASS